MEEDLRLQKLELAVNNINFKLNNHDGVILRLDKVLSEQGKDINMLHDLVIETKKQTGVLLELAPSIKSMEVYAGKTYDVVRPLSKIVNVVVKVGALALVVWHAVKWAAAKLMLWS